MNIYDISKQAGVSIATVSRVLNGSDKVAPHQGKVLRSWNKTATRQTPLRAAWG